MNNLRMKLLNPFSRASLVVWPALALAVAACSVSAWAGPAGVPLKASLVTEETLGFDPARCPVTGIVGTTTGTGLASHLGAVTMVATDCPVLAPGVLPTFSDGVMTLTAQNGDALNARYQGALHPVDEAAGRYSIVGDFSITSGTGRFAGAKGSGTLRGMIDLGPSVSKGTYQVLGTLSY